MITYSSKRHSWTKHPRPKAISQTLANQIHRQVRHLTSKEFAGLQVQSCSHLHSSSIKLMPDIEQYVSRHPLRPLTAVLRIEKCSRVAQALLQKQGHPWSAPPCIRRFRTVLANASGIAWGVAAPGSPSLASRNRWIHRVGP